MAHTVRHYASFPGLLPSVMTLLYVDLKRSNIDDTWVKCSLKALIHGASIFIVSRGLYASVCYSVVVGTLEGDPLGVKIPPQTKFERILQSPCPSVCRIYHLFRGYPSHHWTDFIKTLCIYYMNNEVVHQLFWLRYFNMQGIYGILFFSFWGGVVSFQSIF